MNVLVLALAAPKYALIDVTHHFLAEEIKTLQRPHSLCARIHVAEHNVCLAAHLRSLEGDNIENNTVCGEEHVQVPLEVILGELVGEVAAVETV